MNHHITLKLESTDDFNQLVTVIEGAGFGIFKVDHQELEVECKVDSFILSLAEKYLEAGVVYHNAPAVIIKDALTRRFSSATG